LLNPSLLKKEMSSCPTHSSVSKDLCMALLSRAASRGFTQPLITEVAKVTRTQVDTPETAFETLVNHALYAHNEYATGTAIADLLLIARASSSEEEGDGNAATLEMLRKAVRFSIAKMLETSLDNLRTNNPFGICYRVAISGRCLDLEDLNSRMQPLVNSYNVLWSSEDGADERSEISRWLLQRYRDRANECKTEAATSKYAVTWESLPAIFTLDQTQRNTPLVSENISAAAQIERQLRAELQFSWAWMVLDPNFVKKWCVHAHGRIAAYFAAAHEAEASRELWEFFKPDGDPMLHMRAPHGGIACASSSSPLATRDSLPVPKGVIKVALRRLLVVESGSDCLHGLLLSLKPNNRVSACTSVRTWIINSIAAQILGADKDNPREKEEDFPSLYKALYKEPFPVGLVIEQINTSLKAVRDALVLIQQALTSNTPLGLPEFTKVMQTPTPGYLAPNMWTKLDATGYVKPCDSETMARTWKMYSGGEPVLTDVTKSQYAALASAYVSCAKQMTDEASLLQSTFSSA
jgi:hypothetical protein